MSHSDDECGGIPPCGAALADGCRQTVQAGGPGHRGDLEDADLNAPELLAKVYAGARYKDGVEVTKEGVAA